MLWVALIPRDGGDKPFYITFGMQECYPLNHVYIRSVRSIIEATEKLLGVGGIWSAGMVLWWGRFEQLFGLGRGEFSKNFPKIQMPGGCPGGVLSNLMRKSDVSLEWPSDSTNCCGLICWGGIRLPARSQSNRLNARRTYKLFAEFPQKESSKRTENILNLFGTKKRL